jgi:hypothetical protein
VYRDPSDSRISFGDIFESAHLIDVFVQSGTCPVGGAEMPRPLANKIAGAVGFDIPGDQEMIPFYTPVIPLRREQYDVLSQGTTMKEPPVRAILLSDNCAVDSVLLVDRAKRRARGRLLFAPILVADAARIKSLQVHAAFGKFPLPEREHEKDGDIEFDGGVVDLARCFMADGRAVEKDTRVLGLTDEAAEDLEIAWHAYALRRGPLTTTHNVNKLAQQLGGVDAGNRVEKIEATLALAWRLEGSLRAAANSRVHDPANTDTLATDLENLSQAASEARERLINSQQK